MEISIQCFLRCSRYRNGPAVPERDMQKMDRVKIALRHGLSNPWGRSWALFPHVLQWKMSVTWQGTQGADVEREDGFMNPIFGCMYPIFGSFVPDDSKTGCTNPLHSQTRFGDPFRNFNTIGNFYACSSQNSFWDCYGSFDEQRLFSVKFARFRNFFDFAQIWGILESDKLWEIQCWQVADGKDESE